jgi:hypothetical protein
MPQVNEKYKCSLEYTLPWARFELTTLVIAEIVVNSTTVPLFDLKSVPTLSKNTNYRYTNTGKDRYFISNTKKNIVLFLLL